VRVPLSWLRDFAPFGDDVAALARQLDELGLVVEEVVRVGDGLGDVVLARVVGIAAIPGADRIRRVTVEAGGEPVEVVCGAWNFAEGDVVPLAPVGAVLPDGSEIERRKMKGVVSNGMLCSGRELGLSEDQEGILVLARADAGPGTPSPDGASPTSGPSHALEPGAPFVDALGIGPDVVFDISVEANRPDAWCVAGIARDLAAALRLPFAIPDPRAPAVDDTTPVSSLAGVEVLDFDLCPRFTARVLLNVTVSASPAWIARRLTLAGMRPINNVVDASNYAMLDLGQPNHPYDLDLVPGGALRVRAGRVGETVTTLDGVERRMGERAVGPVDDRRDCLICDGDDTPIGIGGVMGGETSEITPGTRRVLLEAAYFTPMAIARTSKRLNLRSEASARFERGCDPEGIDRAALRVCELLALSAGSVRMAGGTVDVRHDVPVPARIRVRSERVNTVLGSALAPSDVAALLAPIGFESEPDGEDALTVVAPTYRPDTSREIDVIEEVARHFGYAKLPRRRRAFEQVGRLTPYQHDRRRLRTVIAGLGVHEAWTASLLPAGEHAKIGMAEGVTVSNPLTPDERVLRRSMLPGLLRALVFNTARRQDDVRLFEIGHVFPPPDAERLARAFERVDTVVDERELVSVMLAAGDDDARKAAATWYALADAMGVEGVEVVEARHVGGCPVGLHPARAAWLIGSNGDATQPIGALGEVDPGVLDTFGVDAGRRRVGWLELDLERFLDPTLRRSALVHPVSRFPSSDIDLAFVVSDTVPAAAVAQTLRTTAGELLESVDLFDVYRGDAVAPGTRSLAYRLRLVALDRTLTDAEVAEIRTRCIAAVGAAHGAPLRA
jgi:phenylalanyl-tRNA synthetase beta chain